MKNPGHAPAAHIVGANIARRRAVVLSGGGTQNDQIFKDHTGSSGLDLVYRVRVPPKAFFQIDRAAVAKGSNQLAVGRVDGFQVVSEADEKALIGAVAVLPEVDASMALDSLTQAAGAIGPQFFSCGGVEGNDRTIFRQDVHRPAVNDGIERVGLIASAVVGPCHLQPADIRPVNLPQGSIVRRIRAAEIGAPRGVSLRVIFWARRRYQTEG